MPMKKRLRPEATRALVAGQHIAHQRPKRLHRNVYARIHNPEHPGRHPERRYVGHHQQSQRGADGSNQEKRPAAAPARAPGAVGEVADDGLDEQACGGRGQPQERQLVLLGPHRLENAAHVAVLQGEAKLDAQKAEAHVPDLPEAEAGLNAQRAGRDGSGGSGHRGVGNKGWEREGKIRRPGRLRARLYFQHHGGQRLQREVEAGPGRAAV